MLLRTDEQTMDDLGIFGKKSGSGIYDIYNRLHTRGGEALLQEMFRNPMSDKDAVNMRSSIIEKFANLNMTFPYSASLFDMAEKYLAYSEENSKGKNGQSSLGEREIQNGVKAIIELIRLTKEFAERNDVKNINAYADERANIMQLLADPVFEPAFKDHAKEKLSYAAVTAYDALFRVSERQKIKKLLEYIYYLDVYISVAKTAVERKFVFPKALDKQRCEVKLEGVYHPALKDPVGNDISMRVSKNIIFLTG